MLKVKMLHQWYNNTCILQGKHAPSPPTCGPFHVCCLCCRCLFVLMRAHLLRRKCWGMRNFLPGKGHQLITKNTRQQIRHTRQQIWHTPQQIRHTLQQIRHTRQQIRHTQQQIQNSTAKPHSTANTTHSTTNTACFIALRMTALMGKWHLLLCCYKRHCFFPQRPV